MHDFRKKYHEAEGASGCFTAIHFAKGLQNRVMGKTNMRTDNGKGVFLLWVYKRIQKFGINSKQCDYLPNVLSVHVDGGTLTYEMERYSHTMADTHSRSYMKLRDPITGVRSANSRERHHALCRKYNYISEALKDYINRFIADPTRVAARDFHIGNIMYDQRRKQWVAVDLGVSDLFGRGWLTPDMNHWVDPYTVID